MYRGRFDFENFTTQVHDYDPGIHPYPGGLFWTVPMAADAVTVHTGAGKASMKAANMRLRDYFTIPNALFRFLDPASIAATCGCLSSWRRWASSMERATNRGGPRCAKATMEAAP